MVSWWEDNAWMLSAVYIICRQATSPREMVSCIPSRLLRTLRWCFHAGGEGRAPGRSGKCRCDRGRVSFRSRCHLSRVSFSYRRTSGLTSLVPKYCHQGDTRNTRLLLSITSLIRPPQHPPHRNHGKRSTSLHRQAQQHRPPCKIRTHLRRPHRPPLRQTPRNNRTAQAR